MTKYDEIVSLGEETAEMLFADDEDHQQVVKGEADIAAHLTATAATIDASLKDDLLLIQEYKGEAQIVSEEIQEKKRKLEESETTGKEAKAVDEGKLKRNNDKIDGFTAEKNELDLHVKKINEEQNRLKDRLRKELAVAKSKVRIYSSLTGIEWDSEAEKDAVAGVFSGEKRAAPFHFDKKKKTSVEITNALWDLIDEGGDDDDW